MPNESDLIFIFLFNIYRYNKSDSISELCKQQIWYVYYIWNRCHVVQDAYPYGFFCNMKWILSDTWMKCTWTATHYKLKSHLIHGVTCYNCITHAYVLKWMKYAIEIQSGLNEKKKNMCWINTPPLLIFYWRNVHMRYPSENCVETYQEHPCTLHISIYNRHENTQEVLCTSHYDMTCVGRIPYEWSMSINCGGTIG